MEWLLDSPLIDLLEQITPSTLDEVDEQYVGLLQEFIKDAHFDNERHMDTVGSYRMDLFIASEYALMKLRTYVDGGLDPDSEDGQVYMLTNYWHEFTDSVVDFLPHLSHVIVQSPRSWQEKMTEWV